VVPRVRLEPETNGDVSRKPHFSIYEIILFRKPRVRAIANLKKRAEELKLLKIDINHLKKLRERLVEGGFD